MTSSRLLSGLPVAGSPDLNRNNVLYYLTRIIQALTVIDSLRLTGVNVAIDSEWNRTAELFGLYIISPLFILLQVKDFSCLQIVKNRA